MKKLFSFENNPLNTEKFLYMVISRTPKANVEGSKSSNEKQKNDLQVAETMEKLSLMLGKIDDKINHFEEKVKHYAASLRLVNKNKSKYSANAKNKIRDRLKDNSGVLLKYKILQKRMQKTNEKLSKIETNKNGDYTKVAMETLNKINKTIDKQAKIWDFDLRKDIVANLHKNAFDAIKKNRTNLASVKDLFVMMKDGEKLSYGKYAISKEGNKVTLKFGKVVKEFTISVEGKNLEWVIKDAKGRRIRSKSKQLLANEVITKDKPDLSPHSRFYYYKPGSAKNAYSKYKVKDKIKVAKAPRSQDAEKRTLAKVKVFGVKPKVKTAPKRVVANLAKVEVRPTTELGKRVEGKIKFFQTLLASIIKKRGTDHKAAMQFSARYKEAYGKIQKAIKSLNSAIREKNTTKRNAKLERINNELNLVAQNTNSQFPPRLLQKVAKLKKTAKSKEAIVETPETKKALKKWGQELSNRINRTANEVYGRITAAKQFLGALKARNKMQHLTKYKNALAKVGKAIKATNGTAMIKAANKLADVYKLIPAGLDPVWKKSFMIKLSAPPANQAKVALLPSLINKQQKVRKTPNKAVASKPKPKPKAVLARLKKVSKPKETIAAKEKVRGLSKWVSQNEKTLRSIRREFIIHNDTALYAMYGKSSTTVLTRLNTLNRALKNPKLSFTKAVEICHNLRKGFRHIQKQAKINNIKYVGKDVKRNIAKMTILKFPPSPKNPTVAELKLVKVENKRIAKLDEYTKDIAV